MERATLQDELFRAPCHDTELIGLVQPRQWPPPMHRMRTRAAWGEGRHCTIFGYSLAAMAINAMSVPNKIE